MFLKKKVTNPPWNIKTSLSFPRAWHSSSPACRNTFPGYHLHLSDTMSTTLQKLLSNVSAPLMSSLSTCNLNYVTRDWGTFLNYLQRLTSKCKKSNVQSGELVNNNCLSEKKFHINIRTGHNVSKRHILGSRLIMFLPRNLTGI